MQSESAIGAVPAAADTWTDIGTFTVPAGVKRLKGILANVVPDPGAIATIHGAPVIRLVGSGLLEQSPHEYILQGFTQAITAANSGSAPVEPEIFEYLLDIPVQTGGQITAQINMLDEIPAALTSRVILEYDENTAAAANQMSQYVDSVAPAAAGAWTLVGVITIPQLKPENNPTSIREIVCGVVADVAGNALIRQSSRFRLSGSGLKEGGLHHFLGTGAGVMWTTPGAQKYDRPIVRHAVDLPINAGGQINVEAIHDVEISEGGTAVLGVLYK